MIVLVKLLFLQEILVQQQRFHVDLQEPLKLKEKVFYNYFHLIQMIMKNIAMLEIN